MQEFLKVKRTTLATRCEICHKSDLYDSAKDICLRCVDTFSPNNEAKKTKLSVFATERCKVFHPKNINLENNICEHCSNLSLEAKKQDISEVRSKDWLKEVNTYDGNLDSYEIFKLFLFAAICVGLMFLFFAFTLYPFAVFFLFVFFVSVKAAIQNLIYYLRKNT
jgi:hypothetical protein